MGVLGIISQFSQVKFDKNTVKNFLDDSECYFFKFDHHPYPILIKY